MQRPTAEKKRIIVRCDLCSTVMQEVEMRPHIKYCHPSALGIDKETLLPHCEGCFQQFRHKLTLRRHLKDCPVNPNPFMKDTEIFHEKVRCEICNAKVTKPQAPYHMQRKHPEAMGLNETERFYHCSYCNSRCKSRNQLTKHFKVCEVYPVRNFSSAPRQFTCTKCGALYITKDGLYQHQTTGKCSELPPLLCDRCGYANKCRGNFAAHIKRCKPPETRIREKVICDRCSKTFSKLTSLVEHQKRCLVTGSQKEKSEFNCENCGHKTVYRDCFMIHMKMEHVQTGKDSICSVCKSSGRNNPSIRQKKPLNLKYPNRRKCRVCWVFMPKFPNQPKMYRKERKCNNCEYSTRSCPEMRRHRRIHPRQAYFCERCGLGILERNNLKAHILQQSCKDRSLVSKVLTCDICRFSGTRAELKVHIERLHSSVERIKYACEGCDRTWLMRNVFIDHIRKYSGDKSCPKNLEKAQNATYSCEDCHRVWNRKDRMVLHFKGNKCISDFDAFIMKHIPL